MRHILVITLCFLGVLPSPAEAHEFWLSPNKYVVASGAPISAHIRIGDNFEGETYSYRARRIRRLELHTQTGMSAIPGEDGNEPAVRVTAPTEGLAILAYAGQPYVITYKKWDRFKAFVEHKDADWVLARHEANGWPKRTFKERYMRFAKSFIQVGKGAGQDRNVDLEIEIIAMINPYVDDISGGLPVRLMYQGEPRSDAQVEIFAKDPSGRITVTATRTDADGHAKIPMQPATEYLLDSVVLREANDAPKDGVLWESLWASLTFKTP